MKRMLLTTCISCLCFAQSYAGSTPNNAPAPTGAKQTADNDDDDNNQNEKLLAANETCPTMAPGKTEDQGKKAQSTTPSDAQMQTKCLLAGGSSPSQAAPAQGQKPANGQKKDEKKDPADQDQNQNATQPQLVA